MIGTLIGVLLGMVIVLATGWAFHSSLLRSDLRRAREEAAGDHKEIVYLRAAMLHWRKKAERLEAQSYDLFH